MMSTLIPAMTIIVAILLSFKFAGLFGVSLTAIGMLSILGVILATDTYGPVSDNAAGIAEMAGLKGDVRKRAEELDAVGNTTAAIGKGFAVGSAVLTALALFSVFAEKAQLTTINMLDPLVLSGALIGGILSFIFAALVLNSVGKTAYAMVNEVRRQFRENKDLMKGKAKPDYDRPIQISTQAALKEMMLPGILSIIVPLLVGLIMGLPALGGLLAGMTITAFLLAVTLSNAGGAWDNAKKYIEKGNLGGKGSDAHKAAVVGDTVGDGAKDAAGPSLNIMIKLVSIVALLLAIVLMA
jgi:K(+)-stimulated pyrophosphate-energized sodium pump